MSERPALLQLNPANIPLELRSIRAWVGWRLAVEEGRWTKKPIDIKTGDLAETDNSDTWCDFETAFRHYERRGCDGIGLCRTENFVFIDCDGVFDRDGKLLPLPWVQKILAAISARAYVEKSVSGTGLHGIGRGTLPAGRRQFNDPKRKHAGYAFYDKNRFFTFSGNILPGSGDIRDLTLELVALHRELFPADNTSTNGAHEGVGERAAAVFSVDDSELLDRARRAKNGDKFSRLWDGDWSDYPSQSEADSALCCMLAFWSRRDVGRIDSLFRQSGLMREKWLRDDYRGRTIDNACEKTTEVWEPQRNSAPLRAETPEDLRPHYGWNDTGNADRLAAAFGDDLIYCRERRSYYVWNGKRWLFDEFLEVEKRAEQTIRKAFAEAGAIEDDNTRKMFLQFSNKSLSKNSLANMVHLTKKKVRVISATELDADPWLLNVEDGTIDLRTGKLRPHSRGDLISKLIPLKYDLAAGCPLFTASIYRSMGDGPNASEEERERAHELVEYLQLLFGCAATGKPEKLLVVFYGQLGNNGKTTLLTIISKALGDQEYSTQINIDSLMADPRGAGSNNAINSDLSDLQGARFVFTSEVERGQQLSLARVKYLTGLSSIKARRMRENWISFKPVHKIFMDCNDRPVISNPTDPVWNRVVCVPFDVQIPDEEIDTDFQRKLEAELPGILAFIVEGACKYHRDGLRHRPEGVQASTEEYQQKSDRLKEFIEDCCSLNPNAWTSTARLVAAYEGWCRRNGEKYPLEGNDFTDQIRAKGCRPKSKEIKKKKTRGWSGIDLKTQLEGEEDVER